MPIDAKLDSIITTHFWWRWYKIPQSDQLSQVIICWHSLVYIKLEKKKRKKKKKKRHENHTMAWKNEAIGKGSGLAITIGVDPASGRFWPIIVYTLIRHYGFPKYWEYSRQSYTHENIAINSNIYCQCNGTLFKPLKTTINNLNKTRSNLPSLRWPTTARSYFSWSSVGEKLWAIMTIMIMSIRRRWIVPKLSTVCHTTCLLQSYIYTA